MAFIEFPEKIDPIAVWGAILSTFLAFREIWKTRTQIEVSYNFTGNIEIGNTVTIRNTSETPITISYWELLWLERKLFKWKHNKVISPDEYFGDLKIDGHSSTTLHFSNTDYFDWGVNSLDKSKIYLRLYLAGKRKPILKKVFG